MDSHSVGPFQRALMWSGILSSLLYAAMNIIVAAQWDDYNSAAQTVSELSAIGAPTQPLWNALAAFYTALMAGFGYGVWSWPGASRRQRVTGLLLTAFGLTGLVWPMVPMHQRGAPFGGTDAGHIAVGLATVALMSAAMAVGAGIATRTFRAWSMSTLVVMLIFGTLTGIDSPRLAANLTTPMIGVWERISIGAFLLWVAALAIMLLRRAHRDCVEAARLRHWSRRSLCL